jgi:hypothetical protein
MAIDTQPSAYARPPLSAPNGAPSYRRPAGLIPPALEQHRSSAAPRRPPVRREEGSETKLLSSRVHRQCSRRRAAPERCGRSARRCSTGRWYVQCPNRQRGQECRIATKGEWADASFGKFSLRSRRSSSRARVVERAPPILHDRDQDRRLPLIFSRNLFHFAEELKCIIETLDNRLALVIGLQSDPQDRTIWTWLD